MTRKSLSQRFGERSRVVQAGFGDFGEEVLGQQAGVFGKEAKDEAVEEAGDAEISLLARN